MFLSAKFSGVMGFRFLRVLGMRLLVFQGLGFRVQGFRVCFTRASGAGL